MLIQQKIKANSRKESKCAAAHMSHRHTYKTRYQRIEEIMALGNLFRLKQNFPEKGWVGKQQRGQMSGPVPATFKGSLFQCASLTSEMLLNPTAGHSRRPVFMSAFTIWNVWVRTILNGVFILKAPKCFDGQQWNIIIRTYAGAKMYVIYSYVLVR